MDKGLQKRKYKQMPQDIARREYYKINNFKHKTKNHDLAFLFKFHGLKIFKFNSKSNFLCYCNFTNSLVIETYIFISFSRKYPHWNKDHGKFEIKSIKYENNHYLKIKLF